MLPFIARYFPMFNKRADGWFVHDILIGPFQAFEVLA